MKIIFLLSLLALIACQDIPDDEPLPENQNQNQNQDCASGACVTKSNWTINSSSVNFPEKFSVVVNDSDILSTCHNANAAQVTQLQNARKNINFKYSKVPKADEKLKISIFDHGRFCDKRAIFVVEEDVQYTFRETTSGNEISVILGN